MMFLMIQRYSADASGFGLIQVGLGTGNCRAKMMGKQKVM